MRRPSSPEGSATIGRLSAPVPLPYEVRSTPAELVANDTVARIRGRGPSVGREDPTEITNRLGWLDVAHTMRPETEAIREFVARHAVGGCPARPIDTGDPIPVVRRPAQELSG